jgi:hypothetical protein
MLKLGNKPAVRTNPSHEYHPAQRSTYLQSGLKLLRSFCPRDPYEQSRRIFRREPLLFSLDDTQSELLAELLGRGYGIAPGFFSKELIDRIYLKADAIFGANDAKGACTGRPGSQIREGRIACDGTPRNDRLLEIIDPLAAIPEALDIVFHDAILKVAAHFFRHIPRAYRISIVRYFPQHRPMCLNRIYEGLNGSISLCVIIDLAEIDETRGPLVYIPDVHYVHSQTNDEQPGSKETPRKKWAVLSAERGSIIAIPHRSAQSSLWTYPANVKNNPRTSIVINMSGYKRGDARVISQNRMLKWNFDRMTALQQMFAYAGFIQEPVPALAKVS